MYTLVFCSLAYITTHNRSLTNDLTTAQPYRLTADSDHRLLPTFILAKVHGLPSVMRATVISVRTYLRNTNQPKSNLAIAFTLLPWQMQDQISLLYIVVDRVCTLHTVTGYSHTWTYVMPTIFIDLIT